MFCINMGMNAMAKNAKKNNKHTANKPISENGMI